MLQTATARAEAAEARAQRLRGGLVSAVAILDGEHGDWREFFHADALVIDAALAHDQPEEGR
jgi:hypothetical protein